MVLETLIILLLMGDHVINSKKSDKEKISFVIDYFQHWP